MKLICIENTQNVASIIVASRKLNTFWSSGLEIRIQTLCNLDKQGLGPQSKFPPPIQSTHQEEPSQKLSYPNTASPRALCAHTK